MRGIKYKKIEDKLKNSLIGISENSNILEIGCGSKIYKKIFFKHNYYGLDKHESEWISDNDKPELFCDLIDLKTHLNFELIFSVASIYLLNDKSLSKLVQIIQNQKKVKGRCLIFDYRKSTINKLGNKYNLYIEILKENFSKNIFIDENYEWCSNNILKNFLKKFIFINKLNKSVLIDINFNL